MVLALLGLTGCGAVSSESNASAEGADGTVKNLKELTPKNCSYSLIDGNPYFECTNFTYSFNKAHQLVVLYGALDGTNQNTPSGISTIPESTLSDGTKVPARIIPSDWSYDDPIEVNVEFSQVDDQGVICADLKATFSGTIHKNGTFSLGPNWLGDKNSPVTGNSNNFLVTPALQNGTNFDDTTCKHYVLISAGGIVPTHTITNNVNGQPMDYNETYIDGNDDFDSVQSTWYINRKYQDKAKNPTP